MTVPLRQRRREAATREILDAARARIAESGPAGLSMRSVARDLGMTVQALYHYFPSRDDVITVLITEAYGELADAVEAAMTEPGDRPRFVAAAAGYRAWAIGHPALFQLIYGTPLVGYAAPADGRTTAAARRLAAVFTRELFGGIPADRLARLDFPALSPALRAHLESFPPDAFDALPPPAVAMFVSVWGHLHGLVVLEAFGHLDFIGPLQSEIFESATRLAMMDVRTRTGGGAGI